MNVRVDGKKLRDIRRERAIERRELERLSGVHFSTIVRIEVGRRTARLATAKKLADALGVDPTEFVEEEVAA